MNHPSTELNDIQRKTPGGLTGEESFLLGMSMMREARESFLSSLPESLSEGEKRLELFLHFYEHDFSPEEREKIIQYLRKPTNQTT